jgi:thiamine-phosphate pyrophosphorylase
MVLADDDPRWPADPVVQARAACVGGAAAVQLRAKHATDAVTLAWAAEIRAITRSHAVLFFVNDRFDLALAALADGVHLGQDDFPPSGIPEDLRRRMLIGRSTHTLEEARAATMEPIDYVAFGPVFGTDSKVSEHAARELPLLSEVVRAVDPLPVIAIGGIDAENAKSVAQTGVAGVAVISAVAAAADPIRAARAIAEAIRGDRAS